MSTLSSQPALSHQSSSSSYPRCAIPLNLFQGQQDRQGKISHEVMRNTASLWGRNFSSLYADIKALIRVVMKKFRNRDTIIHPHMKIVDGTFLYLL